MTQFLRVCTVSLFLCPRRHTTNDFKHSSLIVFPSTHGRPMGLLFGFCIFSNGEQSIILNRLRRGRSTQTRVSHLLERTRDSTETKKHHGDFFFLMAENDTSASKRDDKLKGESDKEEDDREEKESETDKEI